MIISERSIKLFCNGLIDISEEEKKYISETIEICKYILFDSKTYVANTELSIVKIHGDNLDLTKEMFKYIEHYFQNHQIVYFEKTTIEDFSKILFLDNTLNKKILDVLSKNKLIYETIYNKAIREAINIHFNTCYSFLKK